MTTILPIMTNTNAAYSAQECVISPAKQALVIPDKVSFSSNKKDENKSNAGWWALGGLAVVAALGIIFRKNIAKAWKDGNFEADIDNVVKNAEKKDTAKLNECIGYLAKKLGIQKGQLKAFVIRVKETMRKDMGLTSNEVLILGHKNDAGKSTFLKCIKADKLDDALLKAFGKDNIVHLDVTVK